MKKQTAIRKMISTEVCEFDVQTDLASLRDTIMVLIETHGESARAEINRRPWTDDEYYIAIYKDIAETDEAMEARLAEEEQIEQYRLQRDKAEFKRLSKMFDSK